MLYAAFGSPARPIKSLSDAAEYARIVFGGDIQASRMLEDSARDVLMLAALKGRSLSDQLASTMPPYFESGAGNFADYSAAVIDELNAFACEDAA